MYSGNNDKEANDWSPWLDFNQSTAAAIPKLPGVYKMHTSMKILYIGSAQNLRQSLLECISDPCIKKAKRFSYGGDYPMQIPFGLERVRLTTAEGLKATG